jgi:hypothetical protein
MSELLEYVIVIALVLIKAADTRSIESWVLKSA